MNIVKLNNISIANNLPMILIAGPCVLESREHAMMMVESLLRITAKLGVQLIYKSSFDKANRTSVNAVRGLDFKEAMQIFADIKTKFNVPIITDVHEASQCQAVAEVVDVLQIPAFLCRQTDLLLAAGRTNKVINVKKGQFLAPWDMQNVAKKIASTGNNNILLCERGTSFGYNNLIVDITGLPVMKQTGYPVIIDATHSVQKPGGLGDKTGGNREMAPVIAKAALTVGIAGVFAEVHNNPDVSPSDAANILHLSTFENTLIQLLAVDKLAKSW
jgi:2-dehydro-3-deoxyphosphooctonate aldolase (KDO 8-P synthase)